MATNFSVSVYVGTYKKYNEGNLAGEWIDLTDFSDVEELLEHLREIHADEEDAEFMIQDWENAHPLVQEIGEDFDRLIEVVKEYTQHEESAVNAYLDIRGDLDCLDSFDDVYQGEWDSEEDFARNIIENCYELPDFALTYFNYSAFARDLFISDYSYQDGHVFRYE